MQNMNDKQRLDFVKNSECVVCKYCLGVSNEPCDVHHLLVRHDLNKDGTWRKVLRGRNKLTDKQTIPLCKAHHQSGGYGVAIHAGQQEWEKNFCIEEVLYIKFCEDNDIEYINPK